MIFVRKRNLSWWKNWICNKPWCWFLSCNLYRLFFWGGGVGPGRRINVICNRTNGKNPLFFYEKTNEIKIFVEKKKCINETKFVHLPSVMAVLIVFCRLYKQNMIIINNTWRWVVFLRSLKCLQYKPTFQSKSFKLLSLSWSYHANLSAYPRLKARQIDVWVFEQYDGFQTRPTKMISWL